MFPLLPDPTAPVHPSGAARRSTPGGAASGARLGPDAALRRLVAGNRRFVTGEPRHGHRVDAARAAAGEPRPYAVILACMDARVVVEAVLDQDFGDVCVVRAAGNVADRGTLASIELAVAAFDIGLVLVLGHTRCAAIATALSADDRRLPGRHVRAMLDEIRAAAPTGAVPGGELVAATTARHVDRTVAYLRAQLPAGSGGSGPRVVGAVYDVGSGRVTLR